MNSVIRPVSLLKQSDIDACVERASLAVRQWEQAWLSGGYLAVQGNPAENSPLVHGGWRAYRHTQGSLIWLHCPDEFEKHIESLVFGLDETVRNMDRHRESELAQGVASKAVDDLIKTALRGLIGVAIRQFEENAEPDPWLFKRYSGTASIKLMAGGAGLTILIPVERLASHERVGKIRASKPLTPLPDALANVAMRVVAELGEVEMSLGSFASLQIGDVINLAKAVDQPLTVYSSKHSAIGAAFLGQRDGHRALDMFKFP